MVQRFPKHLAVLLSLELFCWMELYLRNSIVDSECQSVLRAKDLPIASLRNGIFNVVIAQRKREKGSVVTCNLRYPKRGRVSLSSPFMQGNPALKSRTDYDSLQACNDGATSFQVRRG